MLNLPAEAAVVLLPVNPIIQKTDFCGEASVAMILTYYGTPISQDDVHTRIFKLPANGRGAYSTEIVSKLKTAGYALTVENDYPLSDRNTMPQSTVTRLLAIVRKAIDAQQPVLFGWYPKKEIENDFFGHFSVITGYDDAGLFIIDPRYSDLIYMKDSQMQHYLPLPTLDFSRWGFYLVIIQRSKP